MNKKEASRATAIVVASANSALLNSWSAALPDYRVECAADRTALDSFLYSESAIRPSLFICDSALIHSGRDSLLVELGRISNNSILMMVDDDPDMIDLEWIYCGVRGCCLQGVEANMLQKAVASLLAGEAWLPRRLIAKMIAGILIPDAATVPLEKQLSLESLTQRECEVAKLITEGLNNKLIARKLDVSERTIKAHLGNIFQKLNIDNRLMLALALRNSF